MRQLFWELIDALVPPRATEKVVRTLTLEVLHRLSAAGTLPYHDPRVTALIWEIKYRRNKAATALAAAYLHEPALSLCAEELGTPLLIPVPMHLRRSRFRNGNHAAHIGEALAASLGSAVRYAPECLIRTKDTPTQQGLSRARRLGNVHGSMEAAQGVAGRVCIVVDDVATTGATLAEAERALRFSGARVVHHLVLARS